MAPKSPPKTSPHPTREDVVAFLKDRSEPVGVSELAREFNVKGKDRTALRVLLRELQDDGLVDSPVKRKFSSRQSLGSVAVLEITGPDSDGELRARPVRWAKGEEPPAIFVAPDRGRGRALGAGERILTRLKKNEDGSFDATIMRRLGSTPVEIIGVFERRGGKNRIRSTDRRAKYDYGVSRANMRGAEPGDLVRARVMPERAQGLRQAEIIERIGPMDSPGAIGLVALHSNDIPIAFPEDALREADAARPAGLESRTDLRDTPLVTIDDQDARDFDDAVFAEPDTIPENKGGWRLLVAIADVSWYVRPAKPLDEAARTRGNSVYLPDRVVPMLPEALSAGLCSLKPAEDRPVLVAELQIDAKGHLIGHRFMRALMRSAARLTYQQAQALHDGTDKDLPEGLPTTTIEHLYQAHEALAMARIERGTLELDLPEFRVELIDRSRVKGISRRERLTSHRLIEEFMITANVAAAETLEKHRTACMYRVHETPDPAKISALAEFLGTFGFALPPEQITRAGQLAKLLEKSATDPSAEVIHQAILRCQSQAAYSPRNLGHFGLALQRYAHFTSPIRRYADLLVHRALISALGLGAGGLGPDEGDSFDETGEHISDTERQAKAAEREAVDRYLALYLEQRVGTRFKGRVAGVTRFGLFVRLADLGADGLVPLSLLGDERWHHDERLHTLEGMRSATVFTLGDEVEVELKEASPVTGGLIFLIRDHKPAQRKTQRLTGLKAHHAPRSGPRSQKAKKAKKAKRSNTKGRARGKRPGRSK